MVGRNPNDPFTRYGLAMEYAKHGEFDKALDNFGRLWESHPDYAAAYYHGGQLLVKMGKTDEARRVFEKGIEVTARLGDLHAKSELEMALDEL
jgi:tetratricopeptide (TPR) repeat protein